MYRNAAICLGIGALVAQLGWIDPLFIPLALLAPPSSGFIGRWRGLEWRWIALTWILVGLSMLVSDWIVNNEDQLFHAVLGILMALLSGVGFLAAKLTLKGPPRLTAGA